MLKNSTKHLLALCLIFPSLFSQVFAKGNESVASERITHPPVLYTIAGNWIQGSDGRWWYKHNDGSYTTNGWEQINGNWYYFDSQGRMVTGFIEYNNFTYYCDPSSGAMATGWTLINGYYYFFQTNNDYNLKGRMIKGEVNLNGVIYYLDDNSGRMLTNVWKEMKPIYDDRPRYGYFASSGYMATDSDVPGCADGFNVYSHGTPLRSVNKLRYEISLGTIVWINNSKVTSNIKSGMRQWESTTDAWFTQTQSVDEADIMFRLLDFDSYYGEDNILASTTFFVVEGGSDRVFVPSAANNPRGWEYGIVYINTNSANTNEPVVYTHEVGHFLGLTHRLTERSTVMVPAMNMVSETSPTSLDVKTFDHLYN